MSGANTIRVRGVGCVIIGTEGRTPPLPFITVDEGHGRALIAQKLAAEVPADGVADAAAEAEAEAKAKAEAEAAEAEAKAKAEAEAKAKAEAEANANAETEGEGPDAERANTISEALDLVEAEGLVKSGDRKGHPTVKAIEEITGLTDVTAEEIDAAIAAKGAAE